ncbi:ABC transporter permease [Orrella dioscoreae]|uniref:Dipeptide transport system permease protein DppB (TC 3.A.1.5.2) n=1 Tax=Orrella dioscoreae TaxID=1851544 RepID=A0A1C3K5F6_9BURK|nr:ABC transporter permease [Orrella dioscoreae]SBT26750.1 Dipeptide transport system permease protein DppB (TC 3.A.1.5.2) [Orrella dioscoreae]SOE52345.1 Dipeptide transport system permease protein DppB (TC 3.A.1.5.2) [Orrella dioscoreae]
MGKQLLAGLAQTALVLLVVSVVSFAFLKLAPGDPVALMLGSDFSRDAYDKLYADLGLNQPLPAQYLDWLWRFVRGDWGMSYVSHQDIFEQAVLQALPVTLALAGLSLLLALAVGIPLGVVAAVRRNTWVDMLASTLAIGGNAFPSFYLGVVLIWIFGVSLGWFPPMGFVAPWDDLGAGLWHLALPAVTLGAWYVGLIATVTRSSLLEVLEQPYMAAARARGEPAWRVIWVHGMRNVMMPLVTVIGLQLGGMLRGAVMTEVVFTLPGLGMMITSAVQGREYIVVQAGIMITALLFIVVNFAVDQTYAILDPRLRKHGR